MQHSIKHLTSNWKVLAFAVTFMAAIVLSTIPALAFSGSGTGDSESDPYLITTCAEFREIIDETDAYYSLQNDIDCTSLAHKAMVENTFTGTFEGNNHTITYAVSGVSVNSAGLFSEIQGVVKNLNVAGTLSNGANNTGLLAGSINGGGAIVTNVHVSGSVTSTANNVGGLTGSLDCDAQLHDSSSTASVVGVDRVGGLSGGAGCEGPGGSFYDSFATGDVTGETYVGGLVGESYGSNYENVYATGEVTGFENVGGLVGTFGGYGESMTNSYATGNVISTDVNAGGASSYGGLVGSQGQTIIYRSFATGNIEGADGESIGGLVGITNGTIENSFARGNVSSDLETYVAGLAGEVYGSGIIQNSYATGSVPTTVSNGGFAGYNEGDITASFWDTASSGSVVACGEEDGGTCGATGQATADMKAEATFTDAGWDFATVWGINSSQNDGYPCLLWSQEHCVAEAADDNDGVSKEIEGSAPNDGDGNNDGVKDSEQQKVTSLVNVKTANYTTLEVDTCSANNTVSIQTEDTDTAKDDDEFDYPAGLVDFTLTGCTVGGTETITQYHYGVAYDSLSDLVLRKYDASDDTYQTVEGAVFTEELIGGETALKVVYQVTDGGELDADGLANGEIVDPAGPAVGVLAATGESVNLTIVMGAIVIALSVLFTLETAKTKD